MKKITLIVLTLILTVNTNLFSQENTLNFDGVDDYIQTNYTPPSTGQSAFTYSAWVYLYDTVRENILVGTNTSSSWDGYWFQTYLGYLKFYGGPTGSTIINENQWVHIAVTYDGTILTMYVNGEIDVSGYYTINNTGGELYIGVVGSHLYSSGFLKGNIKNLTIWNVARTQTQIKYEMANSLSDIISETGLVAAYNFNQGTAGGDNTSVTTLNDMSGNANNGTLNGFALTGNTSNWIVSDLVQPSKIDETMKEENTIYPNPATDNVFFNVNSVVNVTITDSEGRIISEDVLTKNYNRLNISNLKPGLYFARINDRKKIITKKIIKL